MINGKHLLKLCTYILFYFVNTKSVFKQQRNLQFRLLIVISQIAL